MDTALKQVPFKERVYLEHFFRQQIASSQLGYPIFFANKSAALTIVEVRRCSSYYPYTVAGKGWQAWKKYEHLFPHPNFIFCEEKQRESNYFHLIVVNKQNLRKVLIENEDLFKEVLDEHYIKLFKQPFSPDLFIAKLEKMKRLEPLIWGDCALYGLIYGFGRESSVNCRRYRKESFPKDGSWERIPAIKKEMVIHGKNGKTYVKGFGIHPVAWSGDPESEEVQKLATIYEEQCIALRRMFRRKSCLKPVLEALCSTDENMANPEL
ncbi:MAG: hypothetical protein H7A36_06140 [Chlamydiales bacterium]|nr:hypothetical protein [Chlamydiales bacterium]